MHPKLLQVKMSYIFMKNIISKTTFILLMLSVLCFAFTGCATMTEGSQQSVAFETLGATEAVCNIKIEPNDYSYTVRPPQTILIRKGRGDMKITCEAPAHRIALKTVQSKPTSSALLNIFNGGIPGTIVDADSGALYKYPDLISIDFTDLQPRLSAYPTYYNSDTIPPSVANGIESYESDSPALRRDRDLDMRHKEAYAAAAREEAAQRAYDKERQRRIDRLEGGFYGDKSLAK